MADGWIRLHRSIQEHWIWEDEPYDKARAFIDLLLLANYEDKKLLYKGEVIECKRGDVNLSISVLADRWHWSRHKVSDFLNALQRDGMISQKRTVHRTVISIVNYSVYQGCEDSKKDNKRTVKGQQKDITNKDNKENKEINNILSDIVDYLNLKCGTNYKASSDKTKRCINARLNEGFKLDDFKTVIDKKCASWLHNERMVQYLRPETLFGTKFESYLNEKVVSGTKGNKFNEMIHTDYDFDALEKALLGE